MLYNLLIAPIETIIDWTFLFITHKFAFLGIAGAIFGVSMVINFLALPIYNIADALQEKERKIQKGMEPRVKRIKQAFKGDEQFMMLSTYYKQNNYHPLYVLRSSLSILLEIPFFIAAYHYLSHCEALQNVSFFILKDLGAPDHLFNIKFGSYIFYINVLPILMTLINIISGAVYAKEAPVREKVQIYVLAALFLVLLYNSPSGLVFYWILNNLFSLVKNVVLKMKNPGKVLHRIISIGCIGITVLFLLKHPESHLWKKVVLCLFTALICFLPLLIKILTTNTSSLIKKFSLKGNDNSVYLSTIFSGIALTLLFGLVLPSSVIATSPTEFSFLGATANPTSYIWSSCAVFAGLFLVWPLIIFYLFNNKVKNILSLVLFTILVSSALNAFIFKAPYGNLNCFFILDHQSTLNDIPKHFFILPLLVIISAAALYVLLFNFKKSIISSLLISVTIAELIFGITKVNFINKTFKIYEANQLAMKKNELANAVTPYYHLSKTNKNVVILFLDRAISSFFPETLAEFPELKKSFDGFTYYPNTISFGYDTKTGTPSMLAGYDYTPFEINKRDSEPLVIKHNEATLVMPKLFSDAGFESTVTDPPWPNYQFRGDLSAFNNFPDIRVTEMSGKYNFVYTKEKNIQIKDNPDVTCRKNIRSFVVMECMFPPLRSLFYNTTYSEDLFDSGFIGQFSNLYYLDKETDFSSENNTFTFIGNETTHDFIMMNPPEYDIPDSLQTPKDGDDLVMGKHVNIASLKQVAKWLDYLRDNDCFDNTRIIIVADHAIRINHSNFEAFKDKNYSPEGINPLFLVKDFDSNSTLVTDYSLMSNADTIYIATKDLPVDSKNPFTGKTFTQPDKSKGLIFYSTGAPEGIEKTQFNIDPTPYLIKDSIYNMKPAE